MTTYVSAHEAARLLGVTKPTLYAYVSRGIVGRRTAADGRTSLYARDELERLAARARRRGDAERPTIDVEVASAITDLRDDGPTYRGHDVMALASTHSFEQVAELLWTGSLPAHPVAWHVDRAGLDRCRAVARAAIEAGAGDDPLVVLALASSVLAGADDGPAAARHLLGIVPTLLGGPRRGSIAARLAGAWHRRPSGELVDAVSSALVLLADHELATSTLAVRVACSVRADPYAAIAAGLQVVRGPLHGAASRGAATLFAEAAQVGARAAVRNVLASGERLPGFGHPVYRMGDPRLEPLLGAVRQIPGAAARSEVVDDVLLEAGRVLGRLPNVDIGLGALLFVGGLPIDAPVLAVARIAGWAAHYAEEAEERPVRYRGLGRPRRPSVAAAITGAG